MPKQRARNASRVAAQRHGSTRVVNDTPKCSSHVTLNFLFTCTADQPMQQDAV